VLQRIVSVAKCCSIECYVASSDVASIVVASCVLANCVLASYYVANCMGIRILHQKNNVVKNLSF
jgi:hypothetical protein